MGFPTGTRTRTRTPGNTKFAKLGFLFDFGKMSNDRLLVLGEEDFADNGELPLAHPPPLCGLEMLAHRGLLHALDWFENWV